MDTIRIACQAKDFLPYKTIKPFQGELKSLSKENFEKLKKQILETGFAFPIFVWKNPQDNEVYTIGGHQRLRTISQLVEREGYSCPDLPVVYIEARDMKEAKKRILQDVAQYGHIESQGLYEFAQLSEIGLEELKDFDLPNLDLDKFEDDFYKDPVEPVTGEIDFSKEIDEKNDYIVLLFNNKEEFKNACEKLNISQVRCPLAANSNPNMEIVGIGRILDGEKTIKEFFK